MIESIFEPPLKVPRGHMQQGVPGRDPYLDILGYTMNAPVLRYWYLVRMIKMLWAAGLLHVCVMR